MKIAIVVFSPTGNTLKVAKMLEDDLTGNGHSVQLLDLTRNGKLFYEKRYKEFLDEKVEAHDILLIGAPVYAHHLHYNMLDVVKSLPTPDGKWSKLAVPFVTYGGISSGIALYEAAKTLKRTGRTVISGMKINAFHAMSRLLPTQQNSGMPGEEAIPLIRELAGRITGMPADTCRDITKELDYQKAKSRIKANLIFREKLWQNHLYPSLRYNETLCTGCGSCVTACPVQRLELKNNRVVIGKNGLGCIHCTQCVHTCPVDALYFDCDREKWDRLFRKAVSGQGPLPSREMPKSAVYSSELPHTSQN